MAIKRDIRDNKIQRNLAGEVLSSSAVESSKILHIDTDLQIPNRIHKSDANDVIQITDKAQNIAFVTDTPTVYNYDHDGFINVTSAGNQELINPKNNMDLGTNDYVIRCKLRINTGTSRVAILTAFKNAVPSGIHIQFTGDLTFYQINTSGSYQVLGVLEINNNAWYDKEITVLIEKKGTSARFYASIESAFDFQHLFTRTVSNEVKYDQAIQYNLLTDVWGGYSCNVDLYYMAISLGGAGYFDEYNTIGEIIPYAYEPFNYIHRYKEDGNKKLYLSSKYLKGAVIDENNKIGSLFSSIADVEDFDPPYLPTPYTVVMHQGIEGKQPLLTSDGILFSKANETILETSSIPSFVAADRICSAVPTSNSTIMLWHKPISDEAHQGIFGCGKIQAFWNIQQSVGLKYGFYPEFYSSTILPLNRFNHLCYVIIDQIGFIIINGILEWSGSKSLVLVATPVKLSLGSSIFANTFSSGVIDDVFFSLKAEIDPTGYSVGQKVFEPPIRGGFESEIKQYPIPT